MVKRCPFTIAPAITLESSGREMEKEKGKKRGLANRICSFSPKSLLKLFCLKL